MRFLLLVVLAALALPLVTRGSYRRLAETRWRSVPLLAVGVGAQAVLEVVAFGSERARDIGFAVLIASYVLLIGFAAGNLLRRGMAIVLLGIGLNAVVVAVNQGMPVEVPAGWQADVVVSETVKRHPIDDTDRLRFLADIVPVPRLDAIVSFGDLILAAGLLDVVFHASRPARRRLRRRPIDLAAIELLERAETVGPDAVSGDGDQVAFDHSSQRVEHG